MQIIRQHAGDSGAVFDVALRNCTGRYSEHFLKHLADAGALSVDRVGRFVLVHGGAGQRDPQFRGVFAFDEYGQPLVQEVTHADGRHISVDDFAIAPKPKRS